jgi:hypothetical protein
MTPFSAAPIQPLGVGRLDLALMNRCTCRLGLRLCSP